MNGFLQPERAQKDAYLRAFRERAPVLRQPRSRRIEGEQQMGGHRWNGPAPTPGDKS